MGHIIRLMIEKETDLNVEMVENLGTTTNPTPGVDEISQVDITATRYTGTDIAGTLGNGNGFGFEKRQWQ